LLAAHHLVVSELQRVQVRVNPYCDQICNIPSPRSGLEAKFSLRQSAAFALAGYDTAAAETFTSRALEAPALHALREKIVVVLDPTVAASQAYVRIETGDGRSAESHFDASRPLADLDLQGQRLRAKAERLLRGRLPAAQQATLFDALQHIAEPGRLRRLLAAVAV
jgi:2-methylcitrate dehydratase PrpD